MPELSINQEGWKAIERSLMNKSATLAVAELKHYAGCEEKDSQQFVDHLLRCSYAWPIAREDELVLSKVEKAFAGVKKPKHFTDYTHCDECLEHDQTLRNSSKETAKREEFGNAGWDPITFSTGEGLLYYFPVLARFALLPDLWVNNDWYGEQIVSHLTWDGKSNKLYKQCNSKQKEAIFMFLKHFEATRARPINNYMITEELNLAIKIWSDM
ncbi:MAG: hypothetical protein KZQ90_17195 [Candidatus Thiodiazotropha sp. (ex Codakia rugifera)]|nr:hypothetical protein [Candidatus Thiodiazotropha sp. (ex Codakia rugifera)]